MTEVMTLREVASFLKVHPNTIYRLARSGKLPAFKMGTDWRFHRVAIEQWVRNRETEAKTERRDEVWHLVHWMVSQGFSLTVTDEEIAGILDWPLRAVKRELRVLAERGYLTSDAGRVALTPDGLHEAGRRFATPRKPPSGHESVATFAQRYVRS